MNARIAAVFCAVGILMGWTGLAGTTPTATTAAPIELGTTEFGGLEWTPHVAENFRIAFLVPAGIELESRGYGEWGGLYGVSRDGRTRIIAQALHEARSLDAIENYADRHLGIGRQHFEKVASGADHNLRYRAYTAPGRVDGRRAGLAVLVARHRTADISYLIYVLSTERRFVRRPDTALTAWLERAQGLAPASKAAGMKWRRYSVADAGLAFDAPLGAQIQLTDDGRWLRITGDSPKSHVRMVLRSVDHVVPFVALTHKAAGDAKLATRALRRVDSGIDKNLQYRTLIGRRHGNVSERVGIVVARHVTKPRSYILEVTAPAGSYGQGPEPFNHLYRSVAAL
jgi:hypothetical protein